MVERAAAPRACPNTVKSLPTRPLYVRDASADTETSRQYGPCMTQHSYTAHITWSGTTAGGYRSYSRDHTAVSSPAAQEIRVSADPAFRGNGDLLNPEQLLAMAAGSCQLLSFLALASQKGLNVSSYTDRAVAVLDTGANPVRITAIVLSPVIGVPAGTDQENVYAIAESAHRQCYIGNTLNCPIELRPSVETA